MSRAIQVELVLGTADKPAHMAAHCMGVRAIEKPIIDLPARFPAYAIAMSMCHEHGWSTDIVHGLLPSGDEVFCFRINRG
jgi:hypothetical protein